MSIHESVLTDETLNYLSPKSGQTIVDGTLGGAGHTLLIAERVAPHGVVVGIDRDVGAIERAAQRLSGLPVRLVHGSYGDLPEILAELQIHTIDGLLLDLGLSSDQLADRERGFSFQSDGPLDMRYDTSGGEPAWRLLNRLSAEHLAEIIFQYGDERYSRRIARRIVEIRRREPIKTADQLAAAIREVVPRPRHQSRATARKKAIDPATRTFQALRIAVNNELAILDDILRRAPSCIRPGGMLVIISFHSLEDRRVKTAFRDDDRYEVVTKKPVIPTSTEMSNNPRARSAKLRAARILERTTL